MREVPLSRQDFLDAALRGGRETRFLKVRHKNAAEGEVLHARNRNVEADVSSEVNYVGVVVPGCELSDGLGAPIVAVLVLRKISEIQFSPRQGGTHGCVALRSRQAAENADRSNCFQGLDDHGPVIVPNARGEVMRRLGLPAREPTV